MKNKWIEINFGEFMSLKMSRNYWWIHQGRTDDNQGDYEEFGLLSDNISKLRAEERPINLYRSQQDRYFKLKGD